MEDVKMVIAVRRDIPMSKSMLNSQITKAALAFMLDADESEHPQRLTMELTVQEAAWIRGDRQSVIVVGVDSQDELADLIMRAKLEGVIAHAIEAHGRAEEDGTRSTACVAFGPDDISAIDRVTGNLRFL